MTTKIALLTLVVVLTELNSALAQVGIGTTDPKTTLQVAGNPTTTTTVDGIQAPALTLAQLDAKVAAYGADQDGAIVYIDDVSATSTETETANITATGYYYYDASNDVWKTMGGTGSSPTTTYSVGDFAQGGIVFWVDETAQHGLVAAKEDQSVGIKWRGGSTNYVTNARGDGYYAGKLNTSIIISVHTAKNDIDNHAALVAANYNVGGFGDWYLPSKEELNLMYQNKATIDATAGANGGSSFASAYYWSSTEGPNSSDAWRQFFGNGFQDYFNNKANADRVRAVRAF